MVKTFKRKPSEIQVVQWTGYNLEEVGEYTKKKCEVFTRVDGLDELCIDMCHYPLFVEMGGYILRTDNGQINTWTRDNFEALWELKE